MIRMQIQFTPEEAERLRQRSQARGMSIAGYVRRAVDDALENDPAPPSKRELRLRTLSVVGKYHSGITHESVGIEHDTYLDDAYGQTLTRRSTEQG